MRTLLLDLETAPNKAFVWGLFKVNVSVDQVEEPGYTLCWSAKWLGEKEIMYGSINDKEDFLERIYKLLEEADVVIHYNGTSFDIPTIFKDFVQKGWGPPAPFKQIDLLKVVRKRFRFPSNKLSYVSRALGIGEKHPHKGFALWLECMAGDPVAWKTMEKYNKQDVKLLETLYYILLPWITGHPNQGLYMDEKDMVCPNCGSKHLQKRGFHYTNTMTYQRYRCNDCGAWSRSRVTDLAKEKRAAIIVGVN